MSSFCNHIDAISCSSCRDKKFSKAMDETFEVHKSSLKRLAVNDGLDVDQYYAMKAKAAAFDRLDAALKRGHSVWLNGKMIDVSGEISEHESLLESLQAVPE